MSYNSGTLLLPSSLNEFLEESDNLSGILVALNAEKMAKISNQNLFKGTSLNYYPDGIFVKWLGARLGIKVARIPGADLWKHILERKICSVGIIGGHEKNLSLLREQIIEDFPKVNLEFLMDGYNWRLETILHEIKNGRVDVLLVAMGSPQQEELMLKIASEFPEILYLGLGGSFDVYQGRINRAPLIIQELGLEWAYRLYKEPKRIKRQIVYPWMLVKLLFNPYGFFK